MQRLRDYLWVWRNLPSTCRSDLQGAGLKLTLISDWYHAVMLQELVREDYFFFFIPLILHIPYSLTPAPFLFSVLLCPARIWRRIEAPEHSFHCSFLRWVCPQDHGLRLSGERKEQHAASMWIQGSLLEMTQSTFPVFYRTTSETRGTFSISSLFWAVLQRLW